MMKNTFQIAQLQGGGCPRAIAIPQSIIAAPVSRMATIVKVGKPVIASSTNKKELPHRTDKKTNAAHSRADMVALIPVFIGYRLYILKGLTSSFGSIL
jgi:CxxC motif-containing protein